MFIRVHMGMDGSVTRADCTIRQSSMTLSIDSFTVSCVMSKKPQTQRLQYHLITEYTLNQIRDP